MIPFYIILAFLFIFLVWGISKASGGKRQRAEQQSHRPKPTLMMLNREGDPYEDEWHTYIAGLRHHISIHDLGGFGGWVETDIYNTHDKNAMGIYNSFGKLLGYIPARELSEYRMWCDGKPQPCVGFIFVEDNQLRGRVKILRPCNKEFMEVEFGRYLMWVRDNYGPEYLPSRLSIDYQFE